MYDNQLTVFGGYGADRSIEVYNGTSWDISNDILAKDFTFGVLVEAKCATTVTAAAITTTTTTVTAAVITTTTTTVTAAAITTTTTTTTVSYI